MQNNTRIWNLYLLLVNYSILYNIINTSIVNLTFKNWGWKHYQNRWIVWERRYFIQSKKLWWENQIYQPESTVKNMEINKCVLGMALANNGLDTYGLYDECWEANKKFETKLKNYEKLGSSIPRIVKYLWISVMWLKSMTY